MTNLGIVYTKAEIIAALEIPHSTAPTEFELVGLYFSKLAVDIVELESAGSLDSFLDLLSADRHFNVQAVYEEIGLDPDLRPTGNWVTENIDLMDSVSPPLNRFIFQNSDDNVLSLRGSEAVRIAISDFQFWNDIIGFVFFSKADLEFLSSELFTNEITFSGAEVNFGSGIFDHAPASKTNISFPTLKAESAHVSANPDLPNGIMGVPCPPVWGWGREMVSHSRIIGGDINNMAAFYENLTNSLKRQLEAIGYVPPSSKKINKKSKKAKIKEY